MTTKEEKKKTRVVQRKEERKDRRLSMVVVSYLSLRLVSMIVLSCYSISTVCIQVSFKSTVFVSLQLIVVIVRTMMDLKPKL